MLKDLGEEAVKKLWGSWGEGETSVVTCTKVGGRTEILVNIDST